MQAVMTSWVQLPVTCWKEMKVSQLPSSLSALAFLLSLPTAHFAPPLLAKPILVSFSLFYVLIMPWSISTTALTICFTMIC